MVLITLEVSKTKIFFFTFLYDYIEYVIGSVCQYWKNYIQVIDQILNNFFSKNILGFHCNTLPAPCFELKMVF